MRKYIKFALLLAALMVLGISCSKKDEAAAESAQEPTAEQPASSEAEQQNPQESDRKEEEQEQTAPEAPAQEAEARPEPALNLRHKTDPAAMGGPAQEPEEHHLYNGVKVGRNDPCPCGSGKKFKKCCGRNL